MQGDRLIFELILNIALLVLIANLISKFRLIQKLILQEDRSLKSQAFLSVVFGGMVVLSTYTGIDIGSYSLNTRVIGAMAAGLLGGPIVGLYASLIGAIYVYLFSAHQAFAMASAFSTMMFGLLGGGFYPYFQRGKWKYQDLFLLTCFAEVCDMVCLLRFTVPVEMALNTILEISLPMILLNASGILIFISSFNHMFIQQDIERSRQLQQASGLVRKCLPLLVKGLEDCDNMERFAKTILEETDWAGVVITSRSQIIACGQKEIDKNFQIGEKIPDIGVRVMETGRMETMSQVPLSSPWYEWMKEYSLVAAPFMIRDQAAGCLIVWVKKQWVFRKSELELHQHLVDLSSYQLALSELERQKDMRQKAEFKALQFQVNPHFLFNALNTVSCVCRENPIRARELLIILANYFRYNLNSEAYMVPFEEEMEHVRDYLELEKARFEEKLIITYDVPKDLELEIPTLILQPIVENAVRYGINREGKRIVTICAREEPKGCKVCICDEGKGMPEEVLKKLKSGESIGNSVGLSNVHKRMKSIYGEENGLHITSSKEGTCVKLCFGAESLRRL
ncbi:LytS/YhcK type 5TM receptor domain-containing protein [Sporofaciens musculi]|uniref:LytS/YhcK type 5TM receptor domain-containing protein n=1 Tax=Sporofaciens musculi TaxID=2681861 RepID=UPI002170A396|nr:LytS/YhcK type 5TM receptor domain-containing protein [Sporofaciens musculi]MCI9422486.1 histidine kinase [Dorea sp.]